MDTTIRRTTTTSAVVVTAALGLSGLAGVSLPASAAATAATRPAVTAAPALTAAERAALRFMREEEQLAHDVYRALFDTWRLPIFANIADAEATHAASVATLLTRYGIPDPSAGRSAGTFADPRCNACTPPSSSAAAVRRPTRCRSARRSRSSTSPTCASGRRLGPTWQRCSRTWRRGRGTTCAPSCAS